MRLYELTYGGCFGLTVVVRKSMHSLNVVRGFRCIEL